MTKRLTLTALVVATILFILVFFFTGESSTRQSHKRASSWTALARLWRVRLRRRRVGGSQW